MIVFVESNFVLELAFEQQDAVSARRILEIAEQGRITLAIPAFALTEPYETLARRTKERKRLLEQLRPEIFQLGRSQPFAHLVSTSKQIADALAGSGDLQALELDKTVRRICACAKVLPLTGSVAASALDLQQDLALSPQDAFILASVEDCLRELPDGVKLFVNKNSRDFFSDEILERLGQHSCDLIYDFARAVYRVESEAIR